MAAAKTETYSEAQAREARENREWLKPILEQAKRVAANTNRRG